MAKRWNKISCGGCYKLHDADNLIPDLANNHYLCEGCYEPRENIGDQQKVSKNHNGNTNEEGESDHKYQKGELRAKKFKRGILNESE